MRCEKEEKEVRGEGKEGKGEEGKKERWYEREERGQNRRGKCGWGKTKEGKEGRGGGMKCECGRPSETHLLPLVPLVTCSLRHKMVERLGQNRSLRQTWRLAAHGRLQLCGRTFIYFILFLFPG